MYWNMIITFSYFGSNIKDTNSFSSRVCSWCLLPLARYLPLACFKVKFEVPPLHFWNKKQQHHILYIQHLQIFVSPLICSKTVSFTTYWYHVSYIFCENGSSLRIHGNQRPGLARYLVNFKRGDYVDIVADPSVQKGERIRQAAWVVWWKCKDSTLPIVSPDIVDNEEWFYLLQDDMFDIWECPRFRRWNGLCMYVLGDVQPCPSGFEFTVQIQPTVGIDEYFFYGRCKCLVKVDMTK